MKSLALVFIALFCISCPYTKVEESFNLQATHDIIHYGTDISKYDHVEFPGVVPRTFIGSLVLGAISKMILLVTPPDFQFINEQLVVRLVLGTIIAAALTRFQTAVGKLYGSGASTAFALLTCCQFHILFWSSRTLPNTLALPLVLMGVAEWIESLGVQQRSQRIQHLQRMIWYLAPAGIIFRFEAGILLAIMVGIEWMVYHNLPFKTLLKHGMLAVILSLTLTILVDSFFWQRWLWPEGQVFYFNAILNKSSEWGTMPFYAYFLLFLPRILMVSYPLALLAYCRDATVRRLLMPSLIYISLFSCLPHKEWRFIIYTIPVWTAAAASLVGSMRSRLGLAFVLSGGLASIVGSVVMLSISMQNYPGGEALARLHLLEPSTQPLYVHLDVPTAMTGASRFGELYRPIWHYSKDESHTSADDFIEAEYTHLITSNPDMHNDHFVVVDEIRGLDSVRLKTPKTYIQDLRQFISNRHLDAILPLDINTAPKLYIMKLREHPQTHWVNHTIQKHPIILYSKTYW